MIHYADDSCDSLYDDYLADRQFEIDFPHGVNNDEWTTRDGRTLKITEMTTRHIRNCMKMIGEEDDFYQVFEAELKRRNEYYEKNIREREMIDLSEEEVPF